MNHTLEDSSGLQDANAGIYRFITKNTKLRRFSDENVFFWQLCCCCDDSHISTIILVTGFGIELSEFLALHSEQVCSLNRPAGLGTYEKS
jgi:hypothetical protein